MKILEVKEFNPPSGQEYDAAAYPGGGAYLLQHQFGAPYIVLVGNGCVCSAPLNGVTLKDAAELPNVSEQAGGVSEATHLKAIAILTGKTVNPITL